MSEQDVLLVIEVSETSALERGVKVPLYARFGIPEVWLVDLAEDQMEVYRQPSPQGYQEVRTVRLGEVVAPFLLSDLPVPVDAILG